MLKKRSKIDIFFNPESLAVIGASEDPKKGGNIVIQNLIEFGFRGRIYPINPKGGEIMGLKVYDSILAVPDSIDIAMVVIPRDLVPQAMEECGKKGVKGVIISTAGFSDSGEVVGRGLEDEVKGIAKRHNFRVMGPNSIGTINVKDGFVTSITTLDRPENPGRVSFFGQTGMFASGFFRWITSSQNFSIAKVACLGNKADLDEGDVLEYLGRDHETEVIGLYFEGVGEGRRFLETAREVSRKKPVVVLKSGRTLEGREAIASHTGSLAGRDAVFDGVCNTTGMTRVIDFDQFYDCLKAFSYVPLPRGNRIGVVSITGVGCVLTADSAGEHGLTTPEVSDRAKKEMDRVFPAWAHVGNPVDMWFAIENVGPKRAYEVIARALMAQEDIDMLLVIFTLIPESEFEAAEVMAKIRDENPEKPILACFMGGELSMVDEWYGAFEEKKIPVFSSPGRMVRTAAALFRYAEFKRSC